MVASSQIEATTPVPGSCYAQNTYMVQAFCRLIPVILQTYFLSILFAYPKQISVIRLSSHFRDKCPLLLASLVFIFGFTKSSTMGILRSGVFGGFSNKVGASVGRRVNGQNIVTGLHHPSNKPFTADQHRQNYKFSLLNGFLSQLSPLIAIGFRNFTKKNTAYNAAFKFNFKTAFILVAEMYKINYPGIVYSRGNVCKPCCLQVSSAAGFVNFTWAAETQTQFSRIIDRATFVIYNVNKNVFLAQRNAAQRQDLGYQFELPPDFAGDELHCYMNFNSENGKLTGESVYGGMVV